MKKNMKRMKQNLEVVKEYLTQQEVEFLCNNEAGIIEIDFGDVNFAFVVSDELVQIYFYMNLPEEVSLQVFDYMNMVNRTLPERHLEIEQYLYKGYRITSRVAEGTMLQISQVEEMLDTCCRIGLPFATWICNNANRNSGL